MAFGICSCFGIRNPRKWVPILMLQFLYKSTWELGVIGYMAMKGELEFKEYASMIIGYIVVFIVPALFKI